MARRKSVAGKGSEKAKARRRSSVSVPARYQAAAEALTLVLDRVDGHIAAVEARRDRAQVVLSRNVRGWLARIRHPDVHEIRRCVAGALPPFAFAFAGADAGGAPRRRLVAARDAERRRKEEEAAAVRLQAVQRGRLARQDMERRHQAATAVQSGWRGHSGRLRFQKRRQQVAATKLQANWRGHQSRARTKSMRDKMLEDNHNQAIVKIQARMRGVLARKQYAVLYDEAAVCTCNRLISGDCIVCDDCYEVFHLECAGYSSANRPPANVPWHCHNCKHLHAGGTVHISTKVKERPAVALTRVSAGTLQELEHLGAAKRPGTAAVLQRPGQENLPADAFRREVAEKPSTPRPQTALPASVQARLDRCQAHLQVTRGKHEELRDFTEYLALVATGDYYGIPPPVSSHGTDRLSFKPVLGNGRPMTAAAVLTRSRASSRANSVSGKGKKKKASKKALRRPSRAKVPGLPPLPATAPAKAKVDYAATRSEQFTTGQKEISKEGSEVLILERMDELSQQASVSEVSAAASSPREEMLAAALLEAS